MTRTEQIEAIREQMQGEYDTIAKRDAFVRLEGNKDFETVMIKGFEDQFLKEQVSMLARPDCQHVDMQTSLNKNITGVSAFQGYRAMVFTLASRAEQSLEQCKKAIQELENMSDEDFSGMEE